MNVTKDNDDNDIQPKDEADYLDKTPKPKKYSGDSVPSSDDGNNDNDMPNRWQGTRWTPFDSEHLNNLVLMGKKSKVPTP